jgi:hypothetical protein
VKRSRFVLSSRGRDALLTLLSTLVISIGILGAGDTRWSQITQETIDGRVWEGVHYRFSDEAAANLGKQVAAWDLPRLYRLGL